LSVRVSRRTVTDDEQADGVLWDQSGKLSSKGARLLRGRGKTLGTIDLHVASRVRERRIVLGISQRQMATTLGLTFQQVHKYEQGKSRISAGRLYDFGKVLGVPITFFFEGITDRSPPGAPPSSGGHTDELGRREAIELFTAYRAISDPLLRLSVRQLARALGPEPNGSTTRQPLSQSRRASRRVRIVEGRDPPKR
jgi:transcriptional regulator with XRE-family HTH domain